MLPPPPPPLSPCAWKTAAALRNFKLDFERSQMLHNNLGGRGPNVNLTATTRRLQDGDHHTLASIPTEDPPQLRYVGVGRNSGVAGSSGAVSRPPTHELGADQPHMLRAPLVYRTARKTRDERAFAFFELETHTRPSLTLAVRAYPET